MILASFTAAENYLLGSDAIRHESFGVGAGGKSAEGGSRVVHV